MFPECSAPNEKEMPMLATALTLALLGMMVAVLAHLVRQDGRKILAALQGQSWTSQPASLVRPVTVRFSPRYPSARALRVQPELRAAA